MEYGDFLVRFGKFSLSVKAALSSLDLWSLFSKLVNYD